MAMAIVDVHDAVSLDARFRLPTASSAVCRCGAVYDNGNVAVPAHLVGLCGRCAIDRRMRLAALSSRRTVAP